MGELARFGHERLISLGKHCVQRRRIGVLEHETSNVPELVGEVFVAAHAILVELEVVARLCADNEREARGVGTILLDHGEWVDDVAQALRHLAALTVAHETV